MRIPLLRFGSEKPPIAPWEWWFLPLIIVGLTLYIFVTSMLAVIFAPAIVVVMLVGERKLRCRLAERGRFIDWATLESKLRGGEGTLILHHESPKGPLRVWWTEEDLLPLLPSPSQYPEIVNYANHVVANYLESGFAKLSRGVPWRFCPVAKCFPSAKVLSILETSFAQVGEGPTLGPTARYVVVAVNVLLYLLLTYGIYVAIRY